jgi:hypothetical protein
LITPIISSSISEDELLLGGPEVVEELEDVEPGAAEGGIEATSKDSLR